LPTTNKIQNEFNYYQNGLNYFIKENDIKLFEIIIVYTIVLLISFKFIRKIVKFLKRIPPKCNLKLNNFLK